MRIACLLLIVLALSGCATLKKQTDFYNACISDPECKARMDLIGHQIAYAVAPEGTANNVQNILGVIAGLLGSGLAGMIYGRKICEKKVV